MKQTFVIIISFILTILFLTACSQSTIQTPTPTPNPPSATWEVAIPFTPTSTITLPPIPTPVIFANYPSPFTLPQALYFLAQDEGGLKQIFRLSPDGRALRQLTFYDKDIYEFDVASTGDLAFIYQENLYLQQFGKSQASIIALSTDIVRVGNPIWSPDGQKLVFLATKHMTDPQTNLDYSSDNLLLYDLYTHETLPLLSDQRDTSNPVSATITNPAAQQAVQNQTWIEEYRVARWTPDGRYLLVDASLFWYRYDLQTNTAVAIDLLGRVGEISPDGNTVFLGGAFYYGDSNTCSVYESLTQIDIQSETITKLLECPYWDPSSLIYSPDHKTLFFTGRESTPGSRLYAWQLNITGSSSKEINEWDFYTSPPQLIAPDGSFFISVGENKDTDKLELVLIPARRSIPAFITTLPFNVWDSKGPGNLRWGPEVTSDTIGLPILPTLTPTSPPDCAEGYTQLSIGDFAWVAPGGSPNRLRSGPSTSEDVINLLQPGTIIKINRGPVCADGLIFWQVISESDPSITGWTAEGDGVEYWLEPYNP